jgi:hypothetical protein
MNRRTTTWFCWLLAGLFGGLSAGGQALHLLPGLGHDVAGRHATCCHGPCGGHADRGAADYPPDRSGPSFAAEGKARAPVGCVICQFFALAKGVMPPSPPVLAKAESGARPIADGAAILPAAPLPYQPRAPPIGDSAA